MKLQENLKLAVSRHVTQGSTDVHYSATVEGDTIIVAKVRGTDKSSVALPLSFIREVYWAANALEDDDED